MEEMTIEELSSIFLEKFKNPLGSPKIALFLGAGADISSGGISFSTFKRNFCHQYAKNRPNFVHTPDQTLDE